MTREIAFKVATQVAITLLVFTAVAPAQKARDKTASGRFESYLQPFVASGNFTGSVLIARKGQVIFRHAYGMANYELHVANRPETRFHIASVSKPFTAVAILQLEEQGRLTVGDPVARFIPGFPNGDRIKLEHLLTHTSGIPNVNDLPDYDVFARNPHTLEQLVEKFSGLPLEFQPGSDYRYSNSNYNLLALILEKVSGESYGHYVRKHILEIAGMEQSGHDDDALRLIDMGASGYEPAGVDSYERAPYLDWTNKTGNGSLYSTVDDLYLFDQCLNTDKILKAATRRKYFVEGRGHRFGWFQRRRVGHRVMSASGRSPGFTAQLDRYPDDGVTVIVLSNSYATVSQDPIAPGLAAITFGEDPEPPPVFSTVKVAPEILVSYTGQYQYGPDYFVPNARISVTVDGGALRLELGTFRTPLVPTSATDFLERNFLGRVTFGANPSGKVDRLIYRYAGKEFAAKRLTAN
jgi:CubicO group peptidase (beta-lactamase class C family)